MYAHWNGFRLIPRDWMADNVLADNVPPLNRAPVIAAIAGQNSGEGDTIRIQVAATDEDGDTLTFDASGLPPGLSIDTRSGKIGGVLSFGAAGDWSVLISVNDGHLSDQLVFPGTWTPGNWRP